MTKLPPPTEEILRKAKYLESPSARPRGYFDNLIPITRELLAKPMKLTQAAERLIELGTLPRADKVHFCKAMQMRFSRTREKNAKTLSGWKWQSSPFLGSAHVVSSCGQALCGTKANTWLEWNEGGERCNKCIGAARRQALPV